MEIAMTRRVLFAFLLTAFLLGCSSGSDQESADAADSTSVTDTDTAAATSDASSASADSIPMTVSLTLPSSTPPMGKINGGTFRGEAKGARCEHLADARHEWAVIYLGSTDP